MEDRIHQIISEETNNSQADTFADRADAYYRRRPRLISLLHDLYNDYVSLSDRYTRVLTKLNTHHNPSPPPSSLDDNCSFSDAESTISFQTQPIKIKKTFTTSSAVCGGSRAEIAEITTELVMRNVEYEFLKNEMELQARESGRKMELQRSLVEVLEAERLVLLGENSRLVYRAEILAEERNAAFNENAFLRTRANQLAKCVMRMENEKRGVGLESQIDELRRQIYALEMKSEKGFCGGATAAVAEEGERKWGRWWRRLRKIGVGPCGPCMSVGQDVGKSK